MEAVHCLPRLQKRLASGGGPADYEEIEKLKEKIEQLEVELTKYPPFLLFLFVCGGMTKLKGLGIKHGSVAVEVFEETWGCHVFSGTD